MDAYLILSILSSNICLAEENYRDINNFNFNNTIKLCRNSEILAQKLQQHNNKITINELDLYEEIDKSKNISIEDNNSMVKKYLDSIKNLNNKSIDELKHLGYEDDKIQKIKSAGKLIENSSTKLDELITSQSINDAASEVTIYSYVDGYYHDKSMIDNGEIFKTLINLLFFWQWSETPVYTGIDGFGVGLNSNNGLEIENIFTEITYVYNLDNDYNIMKDYSDMAMNNLSVNKNAFNITYPMSIGKNLKKKVALYGYAAISLTSKNSYVDEFTIDSIYTHSINEEIPTFTLNSNGISTNNENSTYQSFSYKFSDFEPIEY